MVNGKGESWFTERDSKGNFAWDVAGEFARQDDELSDHPVETVALTPMQESRLWLQRDYLQILMEQSAKSDLTLNEAVMRFGEVSLDVYSDSSSKEYEYNDQLGLYRKEEDDA